MGNGIAQVAARAGYNVIMHDVREEFLERGLTAIDKSLQRDVDKERLDAEGKQAIIGRIRRTTDFAAFKEAAFVVEAVTEDLACKDASVQDTRSSHTATRHPRLKHVINLDHETWPPPRSDPTKSSACTS